ncbi:receptor-like kinase TMK4 [Ipomoea triloba]|uniref:receptor-like kinase TMK4 n=1 Tax=Ipomoea triloba TaxID=35885 RepID=UPI00125D87E4|nr:receptor-like kinase TMK4 [Ipomoea triloba]
MLPPPPPTIGTPRTKSIFFFCLLLLFSLVSLSFSGDATVMSKLFAAISPAPSGWSISKDHCTWTNVECAKSTGSVVSINLDSQSISGEIPSELKHLTSLRSLSVQNNFLSGRLPSFANMSNLEQLYLDNNKFSSIPSGFVLGVPNLKTFSISENGNLGPWQIPSYLIGSTNLNVFHASNASITGAIPDFFDSFPNLQNLRLSYNNLTGPLPWSIGRSKIQNLWLDNQKQGLSGTIDVISSMTQLSQLWLQGNAFTGPIPDLSKCLNLFDLQLGDNQLTGVVPVSLTGHPNLENITLQNNKLQGPMPLFRDKVKATLGDTNSFCIDTPGPCDPQVTALLAIAGGFGYPITLAQSWKGNDACQNWAFITCDSQGKNVTTVNLGNQRFSGTISPNFSKLTSLRNLYLNDNNLTGPIPENLTTLPNLQVLDVSNNNLSGPIPSFPPAVKISIHGNLFLGKNVSSSDPGNGGSPYTVLNSEAPGNSIEYALTVGLAAKTIILFFAFFVLKSLTVLVCYKCHAWRKGLFVKVARMSNNQTVSTNSEAKKIPAKKAGIVAIPIQVLQKATNFFSQENVLGSGGYGVVYMGELDDETKIAVKRMKDGGTLTKRMNEFQAEISFLNNVRHRNLVTLLGYCINENERLLVYEYMPQGTLGHHLFDCQKHGFGPLTWNQRVTIALDVARGIEYLHNLAPQSFIHRDIKSSNILLNNDMRAKVADFGLVKMTLDGKSSVDTRVAGTFGYLAPEYATTGRVTKKVDVYAFGVVLMELITGKKAVDKTLANEMCHLVTWFHKVIRKSHNLRNAIDPTLDHDEQIFESISKVAELAIHCTANKSFGRPDMGHVVNVLCPYVQQWRPLRLEEINEKCGGVDIHMSLPLVFDYSSTQNLSSIDTKLYKHRPRRSAQF